MLYRITFISELIFNLDLQIITPVGFKGGTWETAVTSN
jgi:hypothetical protein